MEIWIKAGQLLLSLSILVILHEFGHFFPAKLFKTKVEKFYLFFNPWFSLFKVKKGDTEYGIGWLPLGGYVKIAGMVDESMDKEQMEKPPEPHEFRAKPAWQRLIIMVGGVTVNLILGFFIYAMTLSYYGESYLPNDELKDGVWCVSDVAKDMGFKNGDRILMVNGDSVERFSEIPAKMIYGGEATIMRDGNTKTIDIPVNLAGQISEDRGTLFMPRMPFMIGGIPDSSLNNKSGLKKGDRMISIAGNPVKYFDEVGPILKENAGQEVEATMVRDKDTLQKNLMVSDSGKFEVLVGGLGIDEMEKLGYYSLETKKFGFFESFPAGWNKAMDKLGFYISQFQLIFSPETGAYKGVGGFGSIGSIFPATWEWQAFWEITAFLSLILAFMNILPIPALDGGHVMFLLYEMISGRAPSQKFMEYSQMVGMILLLGLLLYANGMDLFRFFE